MLRIIDAVFFLFQTLNRFTLKMGKISKKNGLTTRLSLLWAFMSFYLLIRSQVSLYSYSALKILYKSSSTQYYLDLLVDWQFIDFQRLHTHNIMSTAFHALKARLVTPDQMSANLGTATFTADDVKEARLRCAHFVQIVDGIVYDHPGARTPVSSAIHKQWLPEFLALLKHGMKLTGERILDTEFAFETTDVPSKICRGAPVFSYSRRNDRLNESTIFLVPYFNFNDDNLMFNMVKDIENSATTPLSDKIPTLFWRGSSTGVRGHLDDAKQYQQLTRLKLMHMINFPNGTSKYPDVDAKLSSIYAETPVQLHSDMKSFIAPFVPLPKALKTFKYLLDVEGNSWSDRFKFLALGRVVILHQETPHIDFLSIAFEAEKDYLPVMADLSDLIDVFENAKRASNPELAELASSSLEKAKIIVSRDFAAMYTVKLLQKYSKSLNYSIQLTRDAKPICSIVL